MVLRSVGVACVAVISLVAFALSGCSSDEQPDLAGTSWTLASWAESAAIPDGVTITAAFDETRVSGNSGVNTYFGEYERDGDGSFSAGPIGSTMMAGPEDAMNAETAFAKRLEAAESYAVSGDQLVLKDADGEDSLTFTAAD